MTVVTMMVVVIIPMPVVTSCIITVMMVFNPVPDIAASHSAANRANWPTDNFMANHPTGDPAYDLPGRQGIGAYRYAQGKGTRNGCCT